MKEKLITCWLLLFVPVAFSQAGDKLPALEASSEGAVQKTLCRAVSTEANYVATANGRGRLMVRALSDDRLIWSSYHCSASTLAFSADGQVLASAGRNRAGLSTIRLWDAHDGSQLLTLTNGQEQVRFLLFEESGCMLVSLDSAGVLRCWDVSDGTSLWSHPGVGAVDSLSRSPDGRFVICRGSAKKFRFADGILAP